MKEENLTRAKEVAKELVDARHALKYTMLESSVGVSMWVNGTGSASIQGTNLKKHTQDAIRALLRVDVEERLSELEKEMESL